jgi:transcriptional regulator with XRE-family HTH domain
MDNYFAEWIREQLKAKGWKQADLARAAHIDEAVISNIIRGKRGPGLDSCRAIALALDLSPNVVLEAAGLLKPKDAPSEDAYIHEIINIYEKFNMQNKKELIEFMRMLIRLQEEQEKISDTKAVVPPDKA